MKKSHKLALAGGLLLFTAITASSCTANMCTNLEKCRILFAYEPGISEYFKTREEANEHCYDLYLEQTEYLVTEINPN